MRCSSVDWHFAFSPAMQQVYHDLMNRVRPWEDREGTHTNWDLDGKTPMLDAFETYADEPYLIKLAHAISDSWLVSKRVVYPGDILVGVTRPCRPIYEHFSFGIMNSNHYETLLASDAYAPNRKALEARISKLRPDFEPLSYEYINKRGRELFGADGFQALQNGLWSPGGYQGHTVPSYPMLLSQGIDGTREKIRHYAAIYANDAEKQVFYRALEILLDGFSAYAEGYAETLTNLAQEAQNEADKKRLLRNAHSCRCAAHERPETLHEALQLCWFYSLWDWVDCIGRLDQYIYPYYKRCVETEGQTAAEEQISAFWLKILESGVHNVAIGGVTPEGTDATNELSYLLLQIARTCHFTHPRITVRFHENSPKALMDLVVQMWSEGMSDPAVVSDTNVIPALEKLGIPLHDARDYTLLGCQEIEIPGKSNFGCEDGKINLAKIFELTIHNGCDRETGLQLGLQTGYLTDFHSIADLWDAYVKQVAFFTKPFIELCNLGVDIRVANASKLVKALYTEGCIERGLDHDNGGPLYNPGVIETAGTAAVGDSFAAIEKLVFLENKLDMATLKAAIDADFEGYENVQRLLRYGAPKFGNDDSFADAWCVRVTKHFWSEIGKYRSKRGGIFTGACSLLTAGIGYGERTWAMPDGRNYGEPLGNTIGPREGNDTRGATAMLRSVSKLPLELGVGGTTVNVLLPKSQLQTQKEKQDVGNLIRTFLATGGQLAQITTADREEMLDAQISPDRHRNLIVRVGGFSSPFVELAKQTQDEIISRYV